jgi:hypothetical protein
VGGRRRRRKVKRQAHELLWEGSSGQGEEREKAKEWSRVVVEKIQT